MHFMLVFLPQPQVQVKICEFFAVLAVETSLHQAEKTRSVSIFCVIAWGPRVGFVTLPERVGKRSG